MSIVLILITCQPTIESLHLAHDNLSKHPQGLTYVGKVVFGRGLFAGLGVTVDESPRVTTIRYSSNPAEARVRILIHEPRWHAELRKYESVETELSWSAPKLEKTESRETPDGVVRQALALAGPDAAARALSDVAFLPIWLAMGPPSGLDALRRPLPSLDFTSLPRSSMLFSELRARSPTQAHFVRLDSLSRVRVYEDSSGAAATTVWITYGGTSRIPISWQIRVLDKAGNVLRLQEMTLQGSSE